MEKNEALKAAVLRHARYSLGRPWGELTEFGRYLVTALAVRDQMVDRMIETQARVEEADAKRVYYLSLEFLMGRSLANNLHNLGLYDLFREGLAKAGMDLEEVRENECDAALGNGGLGRLAACFLDSLATLDYPAMGYGIHYEYGLFRQEIENGYQQEKPDNWLVFPHPWEFNRTSEACVVPLFGRVEDARDEQGRYKPMWMDWKLVVGVPHDMPIVGYGGRTVNVLRLYSARSSREFDMRIFNSGDYIKAVEQKMASETISKVLYPSDSVESGKELRLIQEYFLVACALRDIVRRYRKTRSDFDAFPSRVAVQLNDTHPALAVAELMRILVDDSDLPWEKAWEITRETLAYTNHTLLPEALEKWPVSLVEHVLPRHLQIIYEINRRFLDRVAEVWPGDTDRLRRMSLVEEGSVRQLRMAHLAIVGSHSVNGVAALHSELVKKVLVPDFHQLWPERFNNKTNGVTQRRWLLNANPKLADLLTRTVGDGWIRDLALLRGLEPYAADPGFREEFLRIKRANKERLARVIRDATEIVVDPDSLFDIQVKRIHEYKRQLLNVLHVVYEYLALVEDGRQPAVPRTYVFAGKAAPGYWAAKQVIKLIHGVGRVVNRDARSRDVMKVVFVPDYRVSLAERIIPACDLSEQISTAGMEASGTGNMKFAMNGALTIGTLDGANIEILEEVGPENIYIFGLRAEEIQRMREQGGYDPLGCCERDPSIRHVVDAFSSDTFSPGEPGLFDWIRQSLLNPGDPYFTLGDLGSYVAAHATAAGEYLDRALWARKAVLNVARVGKFSSDRTIREYARDIWGLRPV